MRYCTEIFTYLVEASWTCMLHTVAPSGTLIIFDLSFHGCYDSNIGIVGVAEVGPNGLSVCDL